MAPLIENASGEDLIKHRDLEGGSLGMVAEEGGTTTERVSAYDRSQNKSKDRGLSSFERNFLVGFFICALCFFVIRFLYLYCWITPPGSPYLLAPWDLDPIVVRKPHSE
jgi:hypothetical protein